MDRACSTYGARNVHTEFWREKSEEKNHLKNRGVDERIILKWILEM
jgi:hypothetical protein